MRGAPLEPLGPVEGCVLDGEPDVTLLIPVALVGRRWARAEGAPLRVLAAGGALAAVPPEGPPELVTMP
jgi:hypothetical protein